VTVAFRRTLTALALAGAAVAGPAAQAPPSRSQWNGVYTDAQAARGEPFYRENCSMCHGLAAAGTILAPPLAGPAFTAKWKGRPLSALFDIMRTQMPLNLSGHLSPQQNADVLAYILQADKAPAGRVDLPAASEALKGITVLEKRP